MLKVEVYDYETEETTILTLEQFENDFNNDFISNFSTKIKFIEEPKENKNAKSCD